MEQITEPVVIEILDISPQKVHITVPFEDSDSIDINFKYKSIKTISELTNKVKEYFNIEDQKIKLLQIDRSEAKGERPIKDFPSLLLEYDQSIELKMKRNFVINNDSLKERSITLNKKVISIIKEIADEYNSDKSLISLTIDDELMSPHDIFGRHFIPPEEKIYVNIEKCKEFVELNIYENKKNPTKIQAGFAPKMKLKSLRNLKELKDKSSKEPQTDLFFFFNQKLDEQKTFEDYGIIDNEIISVFVAKYYLYQYKNQIHPIPANTTFDDLMKELQKITKLKPEQFFVDQKGKPLTVKAYIDPKLSNGTIFELKTPTKMSFIIDKKYKITATSTQQVKDIVKELSDKSKVPPEKIQLFNNVGVQLRPDSYLYSSFVPEGEGHTYSIQSKRAKRFTFQNQLGKYFEESFLV